MTRLLLLTVLLLAGVLGNRAAGAAWFGDEYFDERCEEETKRRLVFPTSYKRVDISHELAEANKVKYPPRAILNTFHRILVKIEFTYSADSSC